MISENTQYCMNETGEKNVLIKGEGFSISLDFGENATLNDFWIYEHGKNQWNPRASAHYDGMGNLISKHEFTYDQNDQIREYLNFDSNNSLINRTVYENDEIGRSKFVCCFNGHGEIKYTY
jgi:hypothetical protein